MLTVVEIYFILKHLTLIFTHQIKIILRSQKKTKKQQLHYNDLANNFWGCLFVGGKHFLYWPNVEDCNSIKITLGKSLQYPNVRTIHLHVTSLSPYYLCKKIYCHKLHSWANKMLLG